MPRVRRDEKSLYIKFMNTVARPFPKGRSTSPLAPKGTHIREHALVVVEPISGDSQRLLVTVMTNGKFNEVWYLDAPIKKSQPKGKQNAKKRTTKRSTRRRNVGANNRSRKKVGDKGNNNRNRSATSVGRT